MNLRRQTGVSLIELLVTLAAGLILTASVLQIYVANGQTYRLSDSSARVQENARFAAEVLARDVRMTGYKGCGSSALSPRENLADNSSFLYDFATPLEGFEATGTNSWSPTLDNSISNALGGRDVFVIRGLLGNEVAITGTADTGNCNNAAIVVAGAGGFAQDDIAIAGNCSEAAIFQISSLSGTTASHATGGASPGNADTNLGACFAGNGILGRLSTRTYFVRNNAAGVPSLYRTDASGANQRTVELVEGVEDMQVLYGIDTDGDESANQYLRANDVTDWDRVASVRISLLFRSIEDNRTTSPQPYVFNGSTQIPNDRRLRRVLSTTLALRNRLP